MKITYTQTVELDESELVDTPAEVGSWMVDCALSEWYQYDDFDNFQHTVVNGTYTVTDTSMGKEVSFTAEQFFRKHAELIWLGTIENYRHDWIEFAFKSNGATADEYDSNTTDAVLQNMLYGEVVYG